MNKYMYNYSTSMYSIQYPRHTSDIHAIIDNGILEWPVDSDLCESERNEIINLSKYGSYENKGYKFSSTGRIFNILIDVIDSTKENFQITIYPNDLSSIFDLPISCAAKNKVLIWPQQIVLGAPYKKADLHISKNGDVSILDIEWDYSSDYYKNVIDYYKRKFKGELDGYTGKWGVFEDGNMKAFDTFPRYNSMLGGENAFVVIINGECWLT
jgi:hypothetical protein